MHKILHVLKSERIILKIRNTIKDCWEKSPSIKYFVSSLDSRMGVHNEASRKWLRQEPVLLESLKTYFLCKTGFSTKFLFALRQSFFSRTKPDHSHRSIKLMRFTRINYRGPERTMRVDVRTFGVLFPRGSSGQRLRKWWSMVPELDIIQGCSKLCNICR